MHSAAEIASQAAAHGAALANATIYPWLVLSGYMVDDENATGGWRYEQSIRVIWAPAAQMPDPTDFVPEGAALARGEVFQVSRFDDMPAGSRENYLPHYKAWLRARKARSLGKDVADLRPWTDYDPIFEDERARRWAQPGVRFAGD